MKEIGVDNGQESVAHLTNGWTVRGWISARTNIGIFLVRNSELDESEVEVFIPWTSVLMVEPK